MRPDTAWKLFHENARKGTSDGDLAAVGNIETLFKAYACGGSGSLPAGVPAGWILTLHKNRGGSHV